MKIEEYGLLFQPMFFQTDPFLKLEPCAKHIVDHKTANTPSHHMGIKVIWNGKAQGWLQLKIIDSMIYVKLMESRFRDLDPVLFEKLMESLPPMQNHGNLLVGVLIL